MRIRVIVVSSDDEVCRTLREKTDFSAYHMEVVNWLLFSNEIAACVKEERPQLILLDEDSAEGDAESTIDFIDAKVPGCPVIVIGRGNDPEILCRLMRKKIFGYLKKPLVPEETARELTLASRQIQRVSPELMEQDAHVFMQALFFLVMLENKDFLALDMGFVNRITGLAFKEGGFRVILFKLDAIHEEVPRINEKDYYLEIRDFQYRTMHLVKTQLCPYCHEIVFDYPYAGSLAILNYEPEMDREVTDRLDQLREELAEFTISEMGMSLTVCVSGLCTDFTKLFEAREEAYRADWSRMSRGTGKVLYYSKRPETTATYQEALDEAMESLMLTARTLNEEDFTRSVDEIFSLPDRVVMDLGTKERLIDYVETFFAENHGLLEKHMDVISAKEYILKMLNFSHSRSSLKQNLNEHFNRIFMILSEDTEKGNVRELRKAIRFIKENYSQPITAAQIAAEANLNATYFGHLFKKKTGMNLLDYVTNYRITIAQELLLETDLPISEVAERSGFRDQRYFSKRFKQLTGKTPREYRKSK